METAPYVAVAGLVVAGWFLFEGEEASRHRRGFGAAFAAVSAAVFVGDVPSVEWTSRIATPFPSRSSPSAHCAAPALRRSPSTPALRRDPRQARRLAGRARRLRRRRSRRTSFRNASPIPMRVCRSVLKSYWLDSVAEAQPLWRMLVSEPETAAGHYVTPLIALLVLALRMRRDGLRREEVCARRLPGHRRCSSASGRSAARGSRCRWPACRWRSGWRSSACVPRRQPGTASSLKAGRRMAGFVQCQLDHGGTGRLASVRAGRGQARSCDAEHCQDDADYDQLAAHAGRQACW